MTAWAVWCRVWPMNGPRQVCTGSSTGWTVLGSQPATGLSGSWLPLGWRRPRSAGASAVPTVTRFDGRGRLAISVEGKPEGPAPATFARVGLEMALKPMMQAVSWYGLGPNETYPDSIAAGRLGRYQSSVEELETQYVVPQENGHRSEVRWCLVSTATLVYW